MNEPVNTERPRMDVDIACVGFGPAMGGFLTTLSRALASESLPLQVVCYERADDTSFGVSGVVTRARSIRETFPNLNPDEIPMASPVKHEKVFYLLDPLKASRRSRALKLLDSLILHRNFAVELPYIPSFLRKEPGLILSMGQFNQWVASQLMASGTVQIWPGMPVSEPVIENGRVAGIRLVGQEMEIRASLTVVGDGPVGAVGQALTRHFGMPEGHHERDWAVGMKMVVELPENTALEAGTVFHTFGFPEPEIFGFLYVGPGRLASLGIFVPSWFRSPVRTAYRYLQHWMMHPAIWPYLEGGTLRSWGAKSLQESGRRGEPYLVGDGFARIGEGSGSTNMLTGSGVDEAWATGVQLAEGVIELLREGKPFTKENLERTYVGRRRASWVEKETRVAERARDGFQKGFIPGLVGMALAGFSGGLLHVPAKSRRPHENVLPLEEYFRGKISADELEKIRTASLARGESLHDALMERVGWPKIPYDGQLLVSHQDALLIGGKVQAAAGYADHVVFPAPQVCELCGEKICIEMCSGQAIRPGEAGGVPQFDREKCVHCGACLWNCSKPLEEDPERGNIEFRAGVGGLHSAQN